MAKYCSQCGRELKDDEVCNCTMQNMQTDNDSVENNAKQHVTPAIKYTDKVLTPAFKDNLKRILKNPVEAASYFVAVKDTSVLSGIWISNILILFFWILFVNWRTTVLIQELYILYEGLTFTKIVIVILAYIAIYILFTIPVALITRLFDKMRKFTFGQACIITGISNFYNMLVLFLGTFICLILIPEIIKSEEIEGPEVLISVFMVLFIVGIMLLFCILLQFHIYTESMSSMSIRWSFAYMLIYICKIIILILITIKFNDFFINMVENLY